MKQSNVFTDMVTRLKDERVKIDQAIEAIEDLIRGGGSRKAEAGRSRQGQAKAEAALLLDGSAPGAGRVQSKGLSSQPPRIQARRHGSAAAAGSGRSLVA